MWRYIAQRLLWLVVILICVAILIFTIMYFVPGDPALMILGQEATAQELYDFKQQLGLNDPYMVQLGHFLYNTFFKLDFGISYIYKVPVMDELFTRVPRTLTLGVMCIVLNTIIGIPLGIAAAIRHHRPMDHGLMVAAMLGISMPEFWLALMMVVLFSLKLGWLPAFGFESWKNWIMPVIANSIAGIAVNARMTRAAVLETIRADFVTTARAKGLKERKVIYKHMLPNALIPVINMLGGAFAGTLAGTVIIETVFTFPGVGVYMMNGITARDYPIVRSCVLILAIFSALIVLLVDLIYAYIDPRIKAQYTAAAARKGAIK
ncbi:MAG: ABC transporter permease [Clostridiales bacterium]|nr:ABC transporter permease [Clostridiales bacterium]